MTQKDKKETTIKTRWGKNVIDSHNWTAIPNILLERQRALQLDPIDLNILLVLMKYWWDKEKNPFPRKRVIAEIIGRSHDTVRKHLKKMEELGLIERIAKFRPESSGGGQTSNEYSLLGLQKKLSELADQDIKSKQEHKEREARERRGNGKVLQS